MITNMRYDDCEMRSNGDGIKPIYQQREQRNKLALKNLKTGMEGKLGNLRDLQVFNFQIYSFATGTDDNVTLEYNTSSLFPANATQTVMFGVSGTGGKGLYYNIKSINANLFASGRVRLHDDSFIEFYLLQNINTSTTSLGTKIPQPSVLYGNGGGAVSFSTTGAKNGVQSVSCSFTTPTVTVPESTGLRCSGLALKTIKLNFVDDEDTSTLNLNVNVYVDTSSVSSSY